MKERPKKTRLKKTASREQHYVLRLYVAGITPRSSAAIRSITDICSTHLEGRCDLEVIDIYQQPALAKRDQIVAVPTLIKNQPAPVRRFIGNLTDQNRILAGLDIRPKE
ncbi:MAG: circadian clock KaiB family protein [Kiritimatiellia bacterium]